MLLTSDYVLYVQLGDGDILCVADDGSTARPLPPDDRQFGNETLSLCSPGHAGGKYRPSSGPVGAWGDFRVRVQPLDQGTPALILVSTDGYANSFRTEADFLKVGSDLLDIMRGQGPDFVRQELTRLRLRPTRRVLLLVNKKGSGRSSGSAVAAPIIGPLKAVVIPKDRRRPEPIMSIPRSVADVIRNHVTLEVEGIDRMYLNVYQPKLQTEKQAACFFRYHRGQPVASSSLMGVMTNAFLQQVDAFVEQQQIPVVPFQKGQRKDDVAAEYRGTLSREPKASCFSARPRKKSRSFAPRNAPMPRRQEVSLDRQERDAGQPVLLLLPSTKTSARSS